jgi:hypothetical protein
VAQQFDMRANPVTGVISGWCTDRTRFSARMSVICPIMRLETENPFGTEPSPPDVVRFVSILSKARSGPGVASSHVSLRRGSGWCG